MKKKLNLSHDQNNNHFDGVLKSSGGTFKLPFTAPFYIGLGVSAHNNDTIETAIFSNVCIEALVQKPDSLKKIESTLETIAIASFDRRVVFHTESHIESPYWSPDDNSLIYNSNGQLYSIPVSGGEPRAIPAGFATRINNDQSISLDGQYIYFNSVGSGSMQIWRKKADGSEQEQLTFDGYNDWFAHPSPDGQWIVFVSFGTDVPVDSHPTNKDVMLRIMNLDTKEIRVMAKLFGGQGTIDVSSWSPDSEHLAFVSYRLN